MPPRIPDSTPTPFPTFQKTSGEDGTPAFFYEFLVDLSAKLKEQTDQSARSSTMEWMHLMRAIAKHVVNVFPSPQDLPWKAIHEAIKLTEISLTLMSQVASLPDGGFIFGVENVGKDLFVYGMKACTVLDAWINLSVPPEPDYPSPDELQNVLIEALVVLTRSLASCVILDGQDSSITSWNLQRQIFQACLGLCEDMLTMGPDVKLPLFVALLQDPRVHNNPLDDAAEASLSICLGSMAEVPMLLTLALEVVTRCILPDSSSSLALDTLRQTISLTRRAFDYILSPTCVTAEARRARAVKQLVSTSVFAAAYNIHFLEVAEYMLQYLLVRRLTEGPRPDWEQVDLYLQEAFRRPLSETPSFAGVQATATILRTLDWGENGSHLTSLGVVYLRGLIPRMDEYALRTLRAAICEGSSVLEGLVQLVDQKLKSLTSMYAEMEFQPEEPQSSWRVHVQSIVQAIVEPDEISWMNDEESLSNLQYINRALSEIEHRFERPIYNPAATARLALAKQLVVLPCALFHDKGTDCSATTRALAVSIIPACLTVTTCILDGSAEDVTPAVRRTVFDAIGKSIRHHSMGFSGKRLEHVADVIYMGMKHSDRSVRLSAGRALAELVRLFETVGSGPSSRTEPLFANLLRICDSADHRSVETALISAGCIGKICTSESLYRVTSCLISYVGHPNLVIRGNAFLQLTVLAKHYRASPYQFLSPYMSQIAPKLVSRLCTHPMVLTEVSRFLSVTPTAFIDVTLHYTLPRLFADRDHKVLSIIGRELNMRPSSLFLSNAPAVLAHAFLLPPGQTNNVLTFIVGILRETSGEDSIDIPSVVKSCTMNLLAELVIVMGQEDDQAVARATQALLKVEKIVNTSNAYARPPALPQRNDTAWLKQYMLGILNHLSELLRDVRGKRGAEVKKQIIRSLGPFVSQIGPVISNVAPQLMAIMQTMLTVPGFSDVTLKSWYTFLTTLEIRDLAAYIGPSSASFLGCWPKFSLQAQETAKQCLDYIVLEKGEQLGDHLDELVDLSSISQLAATNSRLTELRSTWTLVRKLEKLLERAGNDNMTVALRSLGELKTFMSSNDNFIATLSSGDMFDPLVGRILSTLLAVACRDTEESELEPLHKLAFDCIGMLGAMDPDRFDLHAGDSRMIMLSNFTDENESVAFVLHLIRDVLVGAFRSTTDFSQQNHFAYVLQELLKFCKFTSSLVNPGSSGNSVPLKVRHRWNTLPKHVADTIAPLLSSRFTMQGRAPAKIQHPTYSFAPTYREWIQLWTDYLIGETSERAKVIFDLFRSIVRHKDVGVAHHLLPHLVLNVLVSGNITASQNIRSELLAVLEDQVNSDSPSTFDKRDLSSQAVFMLMDHLNKWVRVMRHEINTKRAEGRRGRANTVVTEAEEQLLRVDSILSSIDQSLMAKAALQCKAYGRALMSFEQQILALQSNGVTRDLHDYYERLHEIYSYLDEPDGMEGVSTLILSPSLEHQIRQHESTGKWTSAQSCWEVRLQHSPNDLQSHLGLLRCLKNLGHYDTMRTHVKGVLTHHPDWEADLIGYQIESGWIVGDWDEVQQLVKTAKACTAPMLMAKILLSMRARDDTAVSEGLAQARQYLGAPITAAGPRGYRRAYDSVLNLHMVHELDLIYQITSSNTIGQENTAKLDGLLRQLSTRLTSTLPAFRTREPVLSMRRTAFGLHETDNAAAKEMISQSWLLSAKLARKAGYSQTAYSAVLQAKHTNHPFTFIESTKLVKVSGEPLRALQELNSSMKIIEIGGQDATNQIHRANSDAIDLTTDDPGDVLKQMKAKALVLRARWMHDSDRYESSNVLKVFQDATELYQKWESGWFHLGQFQDECFKGLSREDQTSRGVRMNLQTVRCYGKAIRYGSKYIYQTVPRLLTLWLDMGEDSKIVQQADIFKRVNNEVSKAINSVPIYKWFTAFPQIVSRVGHSNPTVYAMLAKLIQNVIQEYPRQALWLFASVVKSTKQTRRDRGTAILEKLKAASRNDVGKLITASLSMTEGLLALCDLIIRDDRKTLSMAKDVPRLHKLMNSPLIIPLQESLTASLPPTSSADAVHQPFPVDAPTFAKFNDEIEIMKSLAKPRKITIQGSNGQVYMFLGKPKDDLRKDARLMDFNAIINKLLKSNSESRRRQLYIRTYGVVTLNEECGFIQWVPNTIPFRPLLLKGYENRGTRPWTNEMSMMFQRIKDLPDKEAAKVFREEVLPSFPPVFHEWFIETFAEPSAWLSSRLAYTRTAAVMSMVGFILGLGDRHCENILLDVISGDVVHVDFNCLFEKGKTLETPERVPFRLTQNVVDGLGITGYEGFFRIACEVTMQLLRDNKDSLMSVLDAFVHDPLVEWEDEKRKLEREAQRQNNVRSSVDLRKLAKNALNPIEKKLKGIYSTGKEKTEREISTSSLVQILIQEATDECNLAKMYPGWASWH